MKVLITGAKGFIGSNLSVLLERRGHEVLPIDRDNFDELENYISQCDFIVHLAGVNRPLTIDEFYDGNANLTKKLVDLVKSSGRRLPIIYSSSIQAALDNDYGKSKKMAEDFLLSSSLPVYVYRLANVYGRGCRPNYNSAAATFCYNIAHDLPIEVRDPNYIVHYNYVEDICNSWINLMESRDLSGKKDILSIAPTDDCSLGKLTELIYYYKETVLSDKHLPLLHSDFEIKLFITFLSYLTEEGYSYNFAADERGSFEELYKSKDHGQISMNISLPGITKGGHYHTYKKEIFYTVKGNCLIRQRIIKNNEINIVEVNGKDPKPIDIITYNTHDIKNIGKENSYTIMWISEVYSPDTHDTYKEEMEK